MTSVACPWVMNLALAEPVPVSHDLIITAAKPDTSWEGKSPAELHAELIRQMREFPTRAQRLAIEGYRQVGPC